MSGAVWAVASGIGFGLFQSLNRRAAGSMDVYRSTFVQLLISTVVLLAISLSTQDLGAVWSAPGLAMVSFSAAGLGHFFVGWTLLNASQDRVGAARTSPLLATTPLFGTLIAALTLGEVPSALTLAGLVLIVVGVYVVGGEQARRSRASPPVPHPAHVTPHGSPSPRGAVRMASARSSAWAASAFGLGAALSWAISPIFIRMGLEDLPSPLLGVTVSMVAATAAYGLTLAVGRPSGGKGFGSLEMLGYKIVAGLLVGLATWSRWIALDLTAVAVVLSLSLLSVPTVMILAPVLLGRHIETVTVRLWGGAGLVVGGALLLVLRP
jgi:drug/metabolite transporter (DMT)-like permease